jgi:hypothetical protein
VEALQRLRDERLGLEAAHREETEALRRQVEALESDRQKAAGGAASAREEARDLTERLAGARRSLEDLRRTLEALSRGAQPLAAAAALRIEGGIPFRRSERVAELRAAASLLEGAAADRAAGLRRLLAFLDSEQPLLRSTEVWSAPVALDAHTTVHAYHLRIGLIGQAFVSEDGAVAGVPAKEPGREWLLDLPAARQEAVCAALRVLQRRKAPAISTFPVQLEAAAPAEEKRRAGE